MAFRTEADLLAAAESQEAEEGDHLELKRELPPGEAGAREIGKDLAAMALGGGVILVGVDEGPPPALTPIALAGQRERVESIARGIDPPVLCQVAVIRKDPPVTGFLVITVPISDDAPHAHQGRFYGRFGSISAPLKHHEVRRYFQDRTRSTTGQGATTQAGHPPIDQPLTEWVQADPTQDQRRQAHIFVVARPRQAPPQMLQDAVGTEWETWTRRNIVDGRDRLTHDWSPDVGSLSRWWRVPGGWRGSSDHGPWPSESPARETHWIEMELREDGTLRLFNGRGSDYYRDGVRVIFELIIGGTVRQALETTVRVSDATGYEGTWDVGVALTNLAGAVSYFRMANWWVDVKDLPPYPEDTYRRTWTGTTDELRGDPDAVVDRLVGSINRTLNDGRFQLPAPPPPPESEEEEEAVGEG